MSDAQLLAHLTAARNHVLRAAEGLTEQQMSVPLIPSGWTVSGLLNHVAFDDEMFWISAVLEANPAALEALHDGGHSPPMTGADAVRVHREQITSSDEVLAGLDLVASPRWWPPAAQFGHPPWQTGARSCSVSSRKHPSTPATSTSCVNSSTDTRISS